MGISLAPDRSLKSSLLFKRVAEFGNSSKPLAFTSLGLGRKQLSSQLKDRLVNPSLISQCGSPLCGPSAFLYVLAKFNRKAYANYIMDLCDKGHAKIGHLNVKPSHDCLRANPSNVPHHNTSVMSACDWVGLASLRDSENDVLTVTPHNLGVCGITMPSSLASWFRESGSGSVINRTNLWFDKSLDCLLTANQRAMSQSVAMFIDASLFGGGTNMFPAPNHWIVQTSQLLIDGIPAARAVQKYGHDGVMTKKLAFHVYTWGDERFPINLHRPHLTVEEFLDNFYGFVGAQVRS